ncbi:dynamin family protein [Micrococcus endophyticus]|uniref:dynamin family protein n=1 Tax=Micrococcus endophyticus TaxID=455343 RepID=UPI002002F794|nr:dynamin family protein [Micrococcus endophyticus]
MPHTDQTHPDLGVDTAVRRVRDHLAALELPFETATAGEDRAERERTLHQIEDYVLPRLDSLDAPLLAVVGGSTGAGKSTLVNALVGHEVSRSSALRPTTRQPLLLHNPADAHWFTGPRVLPDLARVTVHRDASAGPVEPDQSAMDTVALVAEPALPAGIALVDAPDIDSVADQNRALARQLLEAADLWIFTTTAHRYADAVPWQLLDQAAARDITVAVVLGRVPEGAAADITPDLQRMLTERGLGDARIHVIPETRFDERGLLPAEHVEGLRAWLETLAADAQARGAVARRTVDGVLGQLAARVAELARAEEDQRHAADLLARVVGDSTQQAVDRVHEATSDGTLLRGEVLARWQDFVGTGEFFRGVETAIGRVRDRLGALVRGRPAPAEEVETALETGLHAVMVEAAAAAAEQIERRWAAEPAGRALVAGRDLGSLPADTSERAAAVVRDWQSDVLALIQEEGAGKRTRARLAATGVNGAAVALMVISFASTGGLVGLEIGIAGGAAVVGQKLLESIFGEDAVRRMARRANELLERRVRALLETVLADRFLPLLRLDREPQATEELRALVPVLRRGVDAGLDGPGGPASEAPARHDDVAPADAAAAAPAAALDAADTGADTVTDAPARPEAGEHEEGTR